MPRAAAIPTRSPVKLPGPTVTAMRSRSANPVPAWSITRARSGISASAWPRAIATLSCARTRSGISMMPAAQASSAVSMARIRMDPLPPASTGATARSQGASVSWRRAEVAARVKLATGAGAFGGWNRRGAARQSDRPHLGDVGDEMAQQVLDAVPQRRRRRRAARARSLHGEIDHAVLVAAKGDVAAVAGDRRPHPRLDQLLDGGDGLGVARREEFFRSRRALDLGAHDRSARHEMLHDGAEDCRLEALPFACGLGHGDEIAAEKHAADAWDVEQPFGKRRLHSVFRIRHVEGTVGEHGPAGQELQRRRVGRRFGLDEHGFLSLVDAGAKARAADLLVLIGGLRRKVNAPFPPRKARVGAEGAGAGSFAHLTHDIASRSSSLRCPGTIATGIGNVPAVLPILETSGPGPSVPVPAASTRMAMSSSSSISVRISWALSPSRITRSGVMPAAPLAREAKRSSTALAASWASAFMMSATPSHCWWRSCGSITSSMTMARYFGLCPTS